MYAVAASGGTAHETAHAAPRERSTTRIGEPGVENSYRSLGAGSHGWRLGYNCVIVGRSRVMVVDPASGPLVGSNPRIASPISLFAADQDLSICFQSGQKWFLRLCLAIHDHS